MTFVPMMWSVSGFTIVLVAAVLLFRSRLARDEEDQLFLQDSLSHEKANQAAIAARVSKVQPVLKGTEIVAALATLFVIGYYVIDIFNQFR
ncbi:MAG TPA: hypothetical protein VGI45_03375 [Terracidiphilus sp.]